MNFNATANPADEYEAAAEAMAEAGFLKNPVEMARKFMPALSPEAFADIESDPAAFRRRVNDYAYGRALAKVTPC